MSEDRWTTEARSLLKAELARRDITYPLLVAKLKDLGVDESPNAIANKISRGTFSAAFMIQVMRAIGCITLRLDP